MTEVIVIGGGLVGASAAYRLARSKVQVTVVDRADPGQATAAGAGILSPATSLRSPASFFPLAFSAGRYYPELVGALAEDGETETGFHGQIELLHVATNDDEAARLPALKRLMEERLAAGAPLLGQISLLDGAEVKKRFPPMGEIPGAIATSGAARVDGRLMRDAQLRAAQKHGARVEQGSADLVVEGSRVTGVRVNGRKISTEHVLISGGAWSNALGEQLGIRLPVYPQRGQIIHLTMPGVDTSRWPIIVGFHSHYLLTFPTNRVVVGASREENSGYDYRMTAGGVHEVLGEALRLAPGLHNATLSEIRIGLRPASPDTLPILGRAPGLQNVWLATGHGASGLQLGPYSGALVADLLMGRMADTDLTPFAPERFA